MSGLLSFVAPLVITLDDVCQVGRGGKELPSKRGTPGWCGAGLQVDSDAKGVHVHQSPHGTGTVTWAELRQVILDGLTPDLLTKATTRYRMYVECVMEPTIGRYEWRTDRVHAARLACHQARYSRICRAMRSVTDEVVRRGLEASEPLTLFGAA